MEAAEEAAAGAARPALAVRGSTCDRRCFADRPTLRSRHVVFVVGISLLCLTISLYVWWFGSVPSLSVVNRSVRHDRGHTVRLVCF